jgi:transposase
MWTPNNRAKYDRDKLRYPSDLTDAEWTLVEPLIPPAKHGGRDREVDLREVVNGIMYVLSTGCQWRYIPKDLPPKSTLHDYLVRWNDDNTLTAIHHAPAWCTDTLLYLSIIYDVATMSGSPKIRDSAVSR